MEQQNKPKAKLTDKAFSRLVLTSVLAIIVCIVCLCSTTYAWFTDSAPSNENEIKMAETFDLTVTVTKDGTPLADIENGVELEAGVVYTVTLSLPAGSASCYCVITAGGNTYVSDYIVSHNDPEPRTLSFTMTVETTQTVTFTSKWGIYSRESDVKNAELTLP